MPSLGQISDKVRREVSTLRANAGRCAVLRPPGPLALDSFGSSRVRFVAAAAHLADEALRPSQTKAEASLRP